MWMIIKCSVFPMPNIRPCTFSTLLREIYTTLELQYYNASVSLPVRRSCCDIPSNARHSFLLTSTFNIQLAISKDFANRSVFKTEIKLTTFQSISLAWSKSRSDRVNRTENL